jgi:poly(3-hydroxybutyrate) depolymerase
MSNVQSKKTPLELADLVLEFNPGASMAQIADVISEWGDLFDDHKFAVHQPTEVGRAAPNRQPPSPTKE